MSRQPPKRRVSRTLFAKNAAQGIYPDERGLPYSLAVPWIVSNEDKQLEFAEDEPCIFAHALEHEVFLYEQRGELAGAIRIKVKEKKSRILNGRNGVFQIPAWVEADGLELISDKATAVLVFDQHHLVEAMVANPICEKQNWIIVVTHGIPRYAMRRLLHRIEAELKLPIYLLTDNDTWGYFQFSLFKRGALDPQAECPFAALKKPRYLGLTASDWGTVKHLDCSRPWKSHWKLRLQAMRGEYDCFRTSAWQGELTRFAENRRAQMLGKVFMQMGCDAFCKWIKDKIRRRDWLA